MGQGSKTSMFTWTWPLCIPIPDIMEHTHSWGTSRRILYTHTCRQHVLDVQNWSKGQVHQDDSTLGGPSEVHSCEVEHVWRRIWTFESPIFGFFPEGVELSFRSIQIRALFAFTMSTTGPAFKDGAGSPLSLSSLSDFSSLTFLSFLAHISLVHAQKSSRHNTRRVLYMLH